MKSEELIPGFWFYVDERDKNKLNWLLYEYSHIIFDHIMSTRKSLIVKWKRRQDETRIAEFCAYYAKRMKHSILAYQSGTATGVLMPEYFVSDFWHTNTRLENRVIMEIAHVAWTEKLQICSACMGGCIYERDTWCELFDRMKD